MMRSVMPRLHFQIWTIRRKKALQVSRLLKRSDRKSRTLKILNVMLTRRLLPTKNRSWLIPCLIRQRRLFWAFHILWRLFTEAVRFWTERFQSGSSYRLFLICLNWFGRCLLSDVCSTFLNAAPPATIESCCFLEKRITGFSQNLKNIQMLKESLHLTLRNLSILIKKIAASICKMSNLR